MSPKDQSYRRPIVVSDEDAVLVKKCMDAIVIFFFVLVAAAALKTFLG